MSTGLTEPGMTAGSNKPGMTVSPDKRSGTASPSQSGMTGSPNKPCLTGMSLEELEGFVAELGQPRFRARQLAEWIYQKGAAGFDEMSNLPAAFRVELAERAVLNRLQIAAVQNDGGEAAKFLFELADGERIESVYLPYSFGASVCVSSQAGCAMGCAFCASGLSGVARNLTAGEMYGQVLGISQERQQRIRSIVLMGSGEPLNNYDEVLKFLHLLHAPYALNMSYRHMTLSTCGIVPKIDKLAGEGLPITLSISLHAPDNELRNRLMPVNRRYPLEKLLPACRRYAEKTGRRVTFEYTLIKEINDHPEQARSLAALLKGLPCHVNLIPLNPVEEKDFERPPKARVEVFAAQLAKANLSVTTRRELGSSVDAACGQLRRRMKKEGKR